jgi:hypothetical protein
VRKYRGRLFVASAAHTLELDAAGEFVFRQIDGAVTVRQIAERIADTYRVDVAQALADSTELVAELAVAGIIDVVSTSDDGSGT